MRNKRNIWKSRKISLSGIFTSSVTIIVSLTSIITILVFIGIYKNAMEQNAITSSEQAVLQVKNMIENYAQDMDTVMDSIRVNIGKDMVTRREFIQNLVEIRKDVVAITVYDQEGRLLEWWASGKELKENYYQNLSYIEEKGEKNKLNLSQPHVESLFVSYYPWVTTASQDMKDDKGNEIRVAMDIQFSNIANYVDDVGIGQHGYCYISDADGNIIYHPQQQLIYFGLKQEKVNEQQDGIEVSNGVIYTAATLSNSDWRIVGVCYVDEMIMSKVESMVELLIFILGIVIFSAMLVGLIFFDFFSKPVDRLTNAMREFEKNAENFEFRQMGGTREITELSDSFAHMVVKIQQLMEKVRKEEIALRKTELKALQAQINPHFLYNTLDSIACLCEDGRNEDAEEMVNALARLFRISISKGHELISIEKEMQHAESYLKIEKFRYKDQFTYTFEVDRECLKYMCNKITLQPIIENAIYHGLNRMVDEGEIRIQIQQNQNDILFIVADNGMGMTKEECEEIFQKEPSSRMGIGIKNVNERIKIYFGDEYGLTIDSELDEGTTVMIRMPKVAEGECSEK